jgi:hypothetical protein
VVGLISGPTLMKSKSEGLTVTERLQPTLDIAKRERKQAQAIGEYTSFYQSFLVFTFTFT